MIKVTVELWPHGDESRKLTIATADIWNDGSGSPSLGSYGYELRGASGQALRKGFIGEFKRQDFSVWWLVAACLKFAFDDLEKCFRDGPRHMAVDPVRTRPAP